MSGRKSQTNQPVTDGRAHGETRAALLRAAAKVFASNGFDGTTVKDLAVEAGVNVSMVSYYFGGKEGLFREALENFGMERVAAAERVLKAPASIEELSLRLQLFAEGIFDIHLKEPDLVKIVHRSIDIASPMTDHLFEHVFSRIFIALQNFLKEGKRKGLLRSDIDAEIVSGLIFGSLVHFINCDELSRRAGGPTVGDANYMDQVIKIWLGTFLHGLTAAECTPKNKDHFARLTPTSVESGARSKKKSPRIRKQGTKS